MGKRLHLPVKVVRAVCELRRVALIIADDRALEVILERNLQRDNDTAYAAGEGGGGDEDEGEEWGEDGDANGEGGEGEDGDKDGDTDTDGLRNE